MKGFAAENRAALEFTAEDRAREAAMHPGTAGRLRIASRNPAPPGWPAGSGRGVSPAHLSLIKDGPEERRRFLDAAYCQLRPGYIASLSEYSRTSGPAQRPAQERAADRRPAGGAAGCLG